MKITILALCISAVIMANATASDQGAPDGYVKTTSVQNGDKMVHTFEKPMPPRAAELQTEDVAFARFVSALPENEKLVAGEFQTLWRSRQNMKMAADIARMKVGLTESEAKMNELGNRADKARSDGVDRGVVNTATGNTMGTVIPVSMEPVAQSNDKRQKILTESKIGNAVLSGVYKRFTDDDLDGFYVAELVFGDGTRNNVRSGQRIEGDINVTVTRDYVTLESPSFTRTLYMGQ